MWVGACIVVVVGAIIAFGPASIIGVYESISFRLVPSSEKAYAYGNRHFNAQTPLFYDIERAKYFYAEAYALDPLQPYIHHQRARIAFLEGRFAAAMALIDEQIHLFGTTTPNSYYVRGLIEGFIGQYDAAASDYETYLSFDPHNWAALNDYIWVLLKAERVEKAREVAAYALVFFPDNPWLLNSHAIALFETGEVEPALDAARRATVAFDSLTEAEWLHAYPGNDPLVAGKGVATARQSALDNMHRIEAALALRVVQ
jgi:tetratricopeptide (TPR) repeat protein